MKTIAWDVDDTLNNLTRSWFEDWWLPNQPGAITKYSQLSENPPSRLLGIENEEYLASLDAFRLSDAMAKVSPIPEVLSWFHEHGEKARHIAVTSTPLLAASLSAAWVMKHFGCWIRSYNILPSARANNPAPVYDKDKISFLLWLGKVDILVEDNLLNLQSARKAGFQTVEIPQPWNQSALEIEEALKQLTHYILEG